MTIKFSPKLWAKIIRQGILSQVLSMLKRSFLREPVIRWNDRRQAKKEDLREYLLRQFRQKRAINIYAAHRQDVKGLSNDDIVLYWQTFAYTHFRWKSDWDKYKNVEVWEDLDEALETKTNGKWEMDCETGSSFIYVMCRLCGVPEDVLELWGGTVTDNRTGNSFGHVWLEYIRELDGVAVKVDWCVYPDLQPMSVRMPAMRVQHINMVWWGWNESHTFWKIQGEKGYAWY